MSTASWIAKFLYKARSNCRAGIFKESRSNVIPRGITLMYGAYHDFTALHVPTGFGVTRPSIDKFQM